MSLNISSMLRECQQMQRWNDPWATTRLDLVHVLRGPGDAFVVGQLHAPHVRAQRHHVRHLERLRIPAIGRVNLSGARATRAALHLV